MAISENSFRRILREEARRALREVDSKTAAGLAAGGAAIGAGVPASLATAGGTSLGAAAATPVSAVGSALAAGGVGGAVGAAVGASVILGGAVLGIGVGTLINKGLNKAGINDAVINWILAQRVSKVGLDFEARLDPTVLAGNLDKATGKLTAAGAAGSLRPMSFTLTGVKGILIDPNTNAVINNSSFHGFAVTETPVNGIVKLRMPKKPEGIFVPAQLVGAVVYEGGARVNLVSKEGTLVAQAGTSVVMGTLISSKKLGT